jgi:PAS domain-containing protein
VNAQLTQDLVYLLLLSLGGATALGLLYWRKNAMYARLEKHSEPAWFALELADEGIFIANSEGRFEYWNAAARHMLGVPDLRLQEADLSEVIGPLTLGERILSTPAGEFRLRLETAALERRVVVVGRIAPVAVDVPREELVDSLTAAACYNELVLHSMPPEDPQRRDIEQALRAAQKATDLLRRAYQTPEEAPQKARAAAAGVSAEHFPQR